MRPSWRALQRALQLTLALVKPDAVAHPLILQVICDFMHKRVSSHRFVLEGSAKACPRHISASQRQAKWTWRLRPSLLGSLSHEAPLAFCSCSSVVSVALLKGLEHFKTLNKPEFCAVHETILDHQFVIVRSKELCWSRRESRAFYQEHSGCFFYQRLVEFMCSGPMRAYILAREEAVTHWRSLMGPTKVYRARHTAPESVRGALGLTDTRNTVHGSDSAASASKEIAFFFPDFNQDDWYRHEEPHLRGGLIYRDPGAAIRHGPGDS